MTDDLHARLVELVDTDPFRLRDEAFALLRRAELAEAAIECVRAAAEDMRTWCSPHGVAVRYADHILAALAPLTPDDRDEVAARIRAHGLFGHILTVRQDVDWRLHRALFGDPPRTGVHVINDQMADDYDPPSTSVNPRPADPTACQGCADSLATCRAEGGRCCDLCQHPQRKEP